MLCNFQANLFGVLAWGRVVCVRDVSFFMRRGGLKILWGGGGAHFFPNLKRGVTFFSFLKKVCNIRNQSASCTNEPLFVSLSNTDFQIHKPHSSKLKDLFINKILYTIF